MRAFVTDVGLNSKVKEVPRPIPKDGELLLEVIACGVCRTDLHIIDGELKEPKLPLILGHQIVGRVIDAVSEKDKKLIGTLRGVAWLAKSCQKCPFCLSNRENLCDSPLFTGYTKDGGFAEYTTAFSDFTFPLPNTTDPKALAPLLCAGFIGYRAYRKCKSFETLGIYGFGSAAQLVTKIALYEGKKVYAFTRDGDVVGQEFAKSVGACWAGGSTVPSPIKLDAAIIFAPVGSLVPKALKDLQKGAPCILGGIHMSDIPSFPYSDLWEERSIESVANLTRDDGDKLLKLLDKIEFSPQVTYYPLEKTQEALQALRDGDVKSSHVIVI